jgi:collagenase-like PrtC family protease
MNGSCQGGIEFSGVFQARIADFVRRLDDIGADSVTVASPFLADIVRKASDRLKIVVGNSAGVVEPRKLKRYEERGANTIVVHWNAHRDFEALKALRACTDLELKVIPNQGCLNSCEWFISHVNIVSHVSVKDDEEIASYGNYDYALQRCRTMRQINPVEFLMSSFIRPEDMHLYLEMGFDVVKFAGRRSTTEWMLNVLSAYRAQSYEGNLFDLSSQVGSRPKISYLPNKALDGWYEYMGSKSDQARFRKRAVEFCRMRKIHEYLNNGGKWEDKLAR